MTDITNTIKCSLFFSGLSSKACSGLAALGHWTREGSTTATQYRCSPGKYADREGSTSSSCTGSCDHGFYCTSGAVSRRQHACGHPGVYCPTGSKKPTRASRGYYTLPEDAAVDRVVGKVNTQVREMCLIVPVGCTLVTSTATLL